MHIHPNDPERSLHLLGASNFRDIGGYVGADGLQVRWRLLFRSDRLCALTDGDIETLNTIGVDRIVDFRGVAERAAMPNHLPGAHQYSLPIEPTVVQRMTDLVNAGKLLTPQATVVLMQQTYEGFVNDNAQRFAALFALLLERAAPIVFHCTAGKDRTGFAAALILLALGVPMPVVMQDYMLTNDLYQSPHRDETRAPREVMEVIWRVRAAFLEAAFQAIERNYAGLDSYLERQLGLSAAARARLKNLYLTEPASA